jgi:hypothetical protein
MVADLSLPGWGGRSAPTPHAGGGRAAIQRSMVHPPPPCQAAEEGSCAQGYRGPACASSCARRSSMWRPAVSQRDAIRQAKFRGGGGGPASASLKIQFLVNIFSTQFFFPITFFGNSLNYHRHNSGAYKPSRGSIIEVELSYIRHFKVKHVTISDMSFRDI